MTPAEPAPPAALRQSRGALIALGLMRALAAVRYDSFLSPENLLNVLRQNSMPGLLALALTFVILSGGIDLSVGALLAVGGVVAAVLSAHWSAAAVAGAVAFTALLGAGNGLLVAGARVQPFVATLATALAARGVLLGYTDEQSVRVAKLAAGLQWLGRGWVGPVPAPVVLLLGAFAAAWAVLGHTRFGRHVYAVGDNEEAARLMGLKVVRVKVAVYALSGALCGLAGVLLAARLGVAQPVAGIAWELNAITAVVLGGTLLSGGQGGAGGTLTGLLLLAVVMNAFNLEGTVNSYWQWVLRGVFLLAVVVVQNRLSDRAARGTP